MNIIPLAGRPGRGVARLLCACLAVLAWSAPVAAAPATLAASPTTLESDTPRMISFRHQHHMWEGPDGATHVVVNRGGLSPGSSLQLLTSIDGGGSWIPGPSIADSNRESTSDGFLADDQLFLVHSTPSGALAHTVLQHDPGDDSWMVILSETAFASPDLVALNPAMAMDATGTVWLSFVVHQPATGNHVIKLLRKGPPGEGWVDTGQFFGPLDNLSIERSARPVATPSGMGMVYAVREKLYWAERDNQAPLDQAWARQTLFTSRAGDNDPYASHFSVAADGGGNIHVAITDGGRVGYFRRDGNGGGWSSKWLSRDVKAGYVQTTIAAGNVFVVANQGVMLGVFQSTDGGATFQWTHRLFPGRPGPGTSFAFPRMESAEVSTGPVVVLHQYEDGGLQRLLVYAVPTL